MRVHADYQRHGFGQAIFTALEKRAKELGYSLLHHDTAVVLVGAQHFYAKNGFKEVRRGQLGASTAFSMRNNLAALEGIKGGFEDSGGRLVWLDARDNKESGSWIRQRVGWRERRHDC
jgi:predicted N-acetyltransferase YhbS